MHLKGNYHHHHPRPLNCIRMTCALLQTEWLLICGHRASLFSPSANFLNPWPCLNTDFSQMVPAHRCLGRQQAGFSGFPCLTGSSFFISQPFGGMGVRQIMDQCLICEKLSKIWNHFINLVATPSILLNCLAKDVTVQAWDEYKPCFRAKWKTCQCRSPLFAF